MNVRIRLTLALILALACGVFIWSRRAPPGERIVYKSYHGDDPIVVPMTFCPPTTDLNEVPLSAASQEFFTGDLLAIEGKLVTEPNKPLLPVILQFIEHRPKKGDLVANSAAGAIEGKPEDFRMLINAPQTPGTFDFVVLYGGTEFIARATIVVRQKPTQPKKSGSKSP